MDGFPALIRRQIGDGASDQLLHGGGVLTVGITQDPGYLDRDIERVNLLPKIKRRITRQLLNYESYGSVRINPQRFT